MDENVRWELHEAWDRREKTWKVWKEAKGTNEERERLKEFARAGRVLKLRQRDGVHRIFDAHARGLERRIREGDSMGLYTHLKGENLETSRKFSSQFIRDEQGGCCVTRRKSSNDGRGTSRRFSTTPHLRSTPRSYIACRNSKSVMPRVNH